MVVRTTHPPTALASALRGQLKSIDPNLPANEFRTLQQLVDKAVSPRRFVVIPLTGFFAFALILASLGIYAVISYSVAQRTIGDLRILDAVTSASRSFVRCDLDRSGNLRGNGGHARGGCRPGWLFAGSPGVANRSNGGSSCRLATEFPQRGLVLHSV